MSSASKITLAFLILVVANLMAACIEHASNPFPGILTGLAIIAIAVAVLLRPRSTTPAKPIKAPDLPRHPRGGSITAY